MKKKVSIFILVFMFIVFLTSSMMIIRNYINNNNDLQDQASQLKKEIDDLHNVLMNNDQEISELKEQLVSLNSEKDNMDIVEPTTRLENQDILSYNLTWLSSAWYDNGAIYGDYYLAFLNKLFYSRDYYWIEEVEFEMEEIERIESTVDSSNYYIKFTFNHSLRTLLTSMPDEISELIFLPKDIDSQMYIKSGDQWYSYIVKDSHLSFDIQLLNTIMNLDYEYNMYVNRE